MRPKRWMTAVIAVALAASTAFAARGMIITKNGQTFEGEITEDVNHYVVMRGNITSRILRDNVASIKYTLPIEQEIKGQWDRLGREDVAGRLALARKAFQNAKYDLARDLANESLAIDANSKDAIDMLDLVRRQILLESRTAAAAGQKKSRGGEDVLLPIVPMSDRDINAIRQAELNANDVDQVRVRFDNDVRRRYATTPGVDAQAFAEMTAFQQAIAIIRNGTPEMRRDVIILSDPASVRGFKNVQKTVLTGCASVACHGSLAAGNFMLYPNADRDGITYVNFYLLTKYARTTGDGGDSGAIFGGAGARMRMIDRERPTQSLLVQYGLPQEMATQPHPKAPLFRPLATAANDAAVLRIGDWIASLRATSIQYDVSYISPLEALFRAKPQPEAATVPAATVPATRPATGPVGPSPMPAMPEAPATTRPNIPMPPPPPGMR